MARLKEYDINLVLENALQLFWKKGYHKTSLSDLTNVTGLHKGSLYSAFKSKEDLYVKSLELYGLRSREKFYVKGCPLEYIEQFFNQLVDVASNKRVTDGCFILNSNIELARDHSKAAKLSSSLFKEIEENFKNVVKLAKSNGKLHRSLDEEELVSQIIGAVFSIREISRFKNDRIFLKNIANAVLEKIGKKV